MKAWKGLLLALAVVVAGCQGPLEVAFSPDSKMVVYEDRGVGFVVRNTSGHKLVGLYRVGDVYGMTWSASGRYLIYASKADKADDKHPPRTRILDLTTGQTRLVPTYMTAPYNWIDADKVVTGEGTEKTIVSGKEVAKKFDVTYHLDTGAFERHDSGPYDLVARIPGSNDVLVGDDKNIYRRTPAGSMQRFPKPDFPSGVSMAITPEGDVLVVNSKPNRRGVTNWISSLAPGKQSTVAIPASLAQSRLSHRHVLRLMGISPDEKWLIVARVEDRSRHAMLRQALAEESALPTGRKSKRSAKIQSPLFYFTYLLVDRATGSSRVICSSPSINMLGLFAAESWSKDGRYMSLSTAEPLKAVMFDVQTGKSTSLGG